VLKQPARERLHAGPRGDRRFELPLGVRQARVDGGCVCRVEERPQRARLREHLDEFGEPGQVEFAVLEAEHEEKVHGLGVFDALASQFAQAVADRIAALLPKSGAARTGIAAAPASSAAASSTCAAGTLAARWS
jgi:hypothetical protein